MSSLKKQGKRGTKQEKEKEKEKEKEVVGGDKEESRKKPEVERSLNKKGS